MNVLKNFEALFVATLGLACGANYVMEADAPHNAAPVARAAAYAPAAASAKAGQADMQVIVVSARRMTAAEKMQSLRDERQASASTQATGRI